MRGWGKPASSPLEACGGVEGGRELGQAEELAAGRGVRRKRERKEERSKWDDAMHDTFAHSIPIAGT